MNDDRDQFVNDESESDLSLQAAVDLVRATHVSPNALSRVMERAITLHDVRPLPSALRRRWLPYSLVTSVAAAIVIAAGVWALVPANSWAEVVKAMHTRAWIHGVFKLQQGDMDCWLSPEHKIHAVRFGNGGIVFDDAKNMIRTQYRVASEGVTEGVIIREPLSPVLLAGSHHFMQMFESMVRGEEPGGDSWPNAQTVSRERRDVTENGQKWTEFDFGLRFAKQDEISHVVIRVDPETKLPASIEFKATEGHPAMQLVLDYPEPGAWPRDIYDLGVPRTAKIDDRMPSKQLEKIIAAVRDGQEKFGPYFAIVAHTLGPDSKPWQADRFDLVWRKGAKFRIESALVLPTSSIKPPADDVASLEWIREQLKVAQIVPSRVCDGRTVWTAKTVHERADPKEREADVNWERFGIVNAGGEFDSYLGCVSSGIMPDVEAYGRLPVPTDSQTVRLVEKPTEGPADCLLTEVHVTREHPGIYHLSRYWYDPEHAFVARRVEITDLRPKREDATHLDVEEVETVDRTPSGVYYPTKVRRTCDNKVDQTQCRWYFVDFNAELPDSVFEPKPRLVSSH
jgi:hypothetical protein